MAQLNYHPAPGLGDLLPGYFAVPQNPVTSGPVTVKPGIGDVLRAYFPVPQNPVKDFTQGQVKMIGQQGMSGCGCGYGSNCGCGGGCGGAGKLNGYPVGMGDIGADWTKFTGDISSGSVMTALQDTIFGVPVWAYGAMLAIFVFTGGKESHYRRSRRAAAAY